MSTDYTAAIEIVFEDDIFVIVNKPAGLATQNTQNPKKPNLYARLQEQLNLREGKTVYLALHHRLDAATSGLVLFCKNRKYNKYVTDLFREKKIQKSYLAIVDILKDESLRDHWTIANKLKTYKIRHFKKAKSSNKGDESITEFNLIKRNGKKALVECRPLTGRLHQIRVHLAESGLPIQGDFHYHPQKQKGELMLHAHSLAFIHPVSKQEICIKAELPTYFS